MASYRIAVIKNDMKSDQTWNIKIRVTHKRKVGYIGTDKYVTRASMDKKFKVTSQTLIFALTPTLMRYRKLELELGENINNLNVKQLIEYLKRDRLTDIDFFVFMDGVISKIRKQGRKKTADNYKGARNNLERYTGLKTLPITFLTSRFLSGFEEWLRNHRDGKIIKTMGNAGVNQNMSNIRATFNLAREHYNNEDYGDIHIKNNPFSKYKLPKVSRPENRNLEIDIIRKIRDKKYCLSRDILAQDVFMISFYLMGMNCVDLYHCLPPKNGRLKYFRTKTRDRTEDNSEMSVKIEPELSPLLQKYKGKNYAFDFNARYANSQNFTKAVDIGLKRIGEDLGLELNGNLTSYYARHSWATIAANDCDVPISVVHKSLSHTDPGMKITERYIKKSYKHSDDANRKVIDLLNRSSDIDSQFIDIAEKSV